MKNHPLVVGGLLIAGNFVSRIKYVFDVCFTGLECVLHVHFETLPVLLK